MSNTPPRWYNVYRNDEEKCVFVGKDGCSGLIRAVDKTTGKKFEWRSTDALSRESGLSKKRVEEILEHYCKKNVIRQHAKDPEKWGYWELVGTEKEDPDVVKKDHETRIEKATGAKPKITPTAVGQPAAIPVKGQAKPVAGKIPIGVGQAKPTPVKVP